MVKRIPCKILILVQFQFSANKKYKLKKKCSKKTSLFNLFILFKANTIIYTFYRKRYVDNLSCSLIGKTPFFGSGLYQFKSGQLSYP